MTDATVSAQAGVKTTGGAFYRLVWKWHFLASLYVLPFMAMLALTGGIYLYKPQIEAWLYADRMNVEAGADRFSYEAQIAAIDATVGVKRVRGITKIRRACGPLGHRDVYHRSLSVVATWQSHSSQGGLAPNRSGAQFLAGNTYVHRLSSVAFSGPIRPSPALSPTEFPSTRESSTAGSTSSRTRSRL